MGNGTKVTEREYVNVSGYVWQGKRLPATIERPTYWICVLCGQERYTSYKTIVGTAYRSGSKCPSCNGVVTLWVIE